MIQRGLLDETRCLIIKDFLFEFRINNDLILRLTEYANNEQCEILILFLCHFFFMKIFIWKVPNKKKCYI